MAANHPMRHYQLVKPQSSVPLHTASAEWVPCRGIEVLHPLLFSQQHDPRDPDSPQFE